MTNCDAITLPRQTYFYIWQKNFSDPQLAQLTITSQKLTQNASPNKHASDHYTGNFFRTSIKYFNSGASKLETLLLAYYL